ncbi:heat shock protein HSP42 RNJ42_00150 [Nakaseomyces bracarensis]|uniref:heat shock protein HSP42 n=1 Tax=Nakaseomyces bracarensis TaxID=273131 RepID=UPI0038729DFD
MSFYQPSLSLYDVLNALAEQQQPRYHNHNHNQRPHQHFGHHHHDRMPMYYRFGNPYYYSPEYYEDEDEDDGRDEEMGDNEMLSSRPFYYHDDSGKNARLAQLRQQHYLQQQQREQQRQREQQQQQYQQQFTRGDGGLAGLLNALLDGSQVYTGEAEAPDSEPTTEQEQQRQEETQSQSQSKEQEQEHEQTKQTPQETTAQENKTSTTDSQQPKSAVPPKLKKRPSSSAFLHQQAPSPVPDPLQLSKPETRMDLPFSPEANIYDTPNNYTVIMALPGASSKAFRIDYHPSSHELLIKGNIEDKFGIDEKYLKITEVKYGAFERTVKFPVLPRIKDEEIKATYSNGLLQIKVPKILDGSEKPAPKKRIVIEEVPDEELEFEENPNPVQN